MEFRNECELFQLMKNKLYTPVVGDILDELGYTHQFLPPYIRPMREDMKIAGKAMTVLMIDVFGPQDEPFVVCANAWTRLTRMKYIFVPAVPNAVPTGESF